MREAVRRKIITYSNLVARMTGFCQAELGVSAVLCYGESQIKDTELHHSKILLLY